MSELRPSRIMLRTSREAGENPRWLELLGHRRSLVASRPEEVLPVLREAARAAGGSHVAGFVTYEAASAFDPALVTHHPASLPLAWFGVFSTARYRDRLPRAQAPAVLDWRQRIDFDQYRRALREISTAIEAGDTYQANFTFLLQASFDGDPWRLFSQLVSAQSADHAAYFDLGEHVICSVSPELFFRLEGSRILCRPMKGTAARGLTLSDDRRAALALYDSAKDRAENLMIVDMVRNDLGRIARPGSVKVTALFDLETYESVHQLTSTVTAETDAPIEEIFTALFPCASITGAPKVSTMRLLAELESDPRGIYTGAVGYLAPGRRAEFNVAIRTVHVERLRKLAWYGTGGGIVWDSQADEEYQECASKARILSHQRPPFELLETLRFDPESGYFLLDRHLDRLADSAEYFGFRIDRSRIVEQLEAAIRTDVDRPLRVRLLLRRDGTTRIEQHDLASASAAPWRLAIARDPIEPSNLFLYHKTTARAVYEEALQAAEGYDDVLLWNPTGRLTEATRANLVLRLEGRLLTPPIDDGLLAGTFREELLANGEVSIQVLELGELGRAEEVWLVNSVRRWIAVERIDELAEAGHRVIWRNLAASRS